MPFPAAPLTPTPASSDHVLSWRTPAWHFLQDPGRILAPGSSSAVSVPRAGRLFFPPFLLPLPSSLSVEVRNTFSEIHKGRSSWPASCSALWMQGLPCGGARPQPGRGCLGGLAALTCENWVVGGNVAGSGRRRGSREVVV